MKNSGGVAFFSYSTNYSIDSEHETILDVDATASNRVDEVASKKINFWSVPDYNLFPATSFHEGGVVQGEQIGIIARDTVSGDDAY